MKRILIEWHEFTLPLLVPRDFDESVIEKRRIISIIGPRRAGKTCVCFEIMADLLNHGIPRENIIYVNFEDERLVPLDGSELTALLDWQAELYKRDTSKPMYCILDEIQNVPNWSKWVRRVVDQNHDLTVILTGSSSKLLSTEIATELRGRATSITIFPYSFKEFLRAHDMKVEYSENLYYSTKRTEIKRLFNEYFAKGGFPEITEYTRYRDTLQQYYRAMFARDMVERFSIKNVRQFEDFLKIQITRFSSLSSISNSEKEMVELGYSLSKNTLVNYFGYAKDVFLFFDVAKYDNKVTRQLRAPKKIYVIDHGMLNAVRFSSSEDWGRILENIAFIELRRRFDTIYYHHSSSECDFVIMEENRIRHCFQVCWSTAQSDTLEREIRGLVDALKSYNLDTGTILTDDDYENLERDGKKIRVRPLWLFMLES